MENKNTEFEHFSISELEALSKNIDSIIKAKKIEVPNPIITKLTKKYIALFEESNKTVEERCRCTLTIGLSICWDINSGAPTVDVDTYDYQYKNNAIRDAIDYGYRDEFSINETSPKTKKILQKIKAFEAELEETAIKLEMNLNILKNKIYKEANKQINNK